jgi:hypothetical protein
VLLRLTLTSNTGKVISQNDYWLANGKFDVSPADLGKIQNTSLVVSKIASANKIVSCEIKNTGKNVATFIKMNVVNPKTGEIILPAFASDGYFSLLPNESRQITFTVPGLDKTTGIKVIAEGLNCAANINGSL